MSTTEQAGPSDCDAAEWGGAPTMLDGQCRCMVCGRCGHHTGNAHQGHHWNWCAVTRSMREPHFCCPDPAFGCELESSPPVAAAVARAEAAEAKLTEIAEYCRDECVVVNEGVRLVATVRASDILAIIISNDGEVRRG